MKFVYPAIIRETEDGYYGFFPDLEMCDAKGENLMQLEDHLKEACINWITLELEEGDTAALPSWSTEEDLHLAEGEQYRYIAVNIRFMPGYDE